MLAYATAFDLPGGLLIYAGMSRPTAHVVRHAGKRLEVVSIDLSGSLPKTLALLRELVAASHTARVRPALAPGLSCGSQMVQRDVLVAGHLHVHGGSGPESCAVHRGLRKACEALPRWKYADPAPRDSIMGHLLPETVH